MTAYRTVIHVPAIIHARSEEIAEEIARTAQAALLRALPVVPDGSPHHDTPKPIGRTVRPSRDRNGAAS